MGNCSSTCVQRSESNLTEPNFEQPIQLNNLTQTKAAIQIQKIIRGFIARSKFKNLKPRHKNPKFSSSTEEWPLPQRLKNMQVSSLLKVPNKNATYVVSVSSSNTIFRKKSSSMNGLVDISDSIHEQESWLGNQQMNFVPTKECDKELIKENGCHPAIQMANGAIYDGEWKNGRPNGKGMYTFSDGQKYDGEVNYSLDNVKIQWKDGQAHGRGLFKHSNGDSFEGEFKYNRVDGFGIYTYAIGGFYKGQWKDDHQHGDGIEQYYNGSQYQGEFKNGLRDGNGKMTFQDGSYYQGEFKNDEMSGEGEYQWVDGRIYQGEWKNGKMHGKGKLQWADGNFEFNLKHILVGRSYEGEYYEDKKHGFGVFELADGSKFSGYWKEGLQDGEGEFNRNGEITKGVWKKGKLQQSTQLSSKIEF